MKYPQRNKEVKKIFLAKCQENQMCRFCGERPATDAAHLIRRSYSSALITHLDNVEPACRTCHDIFDNRPWEAKRLKNIDALLEKIKSMDEHYYNRLIQKIF